MRVDGRRAIALGPYAIVRLNMDPREVKARCVAIEASHPAARLIDLDVYSIDGVQVDRGSLGLPPRICLLCDHSAVECIRLKRHVLNDVVGKVNGLLANFRT